jgi:hypothetical protein
VKKGQLRHRDGSQTHKKCDIPDGIIAHLTRESSGNLHDRRVVDVTSGSFWEETKSTDPYSEAYDDDLAYAAKNAADLETASVFQSSCRESSENIPHTRNN